MNCFVGQSLLVGLSVELAAEHHVLFQISYVASPNSEPGVLVGCSRPMLYDCLIRFIQGVDAGTTDPVAPPPPRSVDVRVWVTRPHIALLEFPMSPNTSALLLEGEQGVYYRWQSLAIAQVCACVCFLLGTNVKFLFTQPRRIGTPFELAESGM